MDVSPVKTEKTCLKLVDRKMKLSYSKRKMLIGFTQTAYEFVIASPLGRGNLLVKCCDNRRSTSRFPRRPAPRNDRLAGCLNKADKRKKIENGGTYGYQSL